MPWYIYVCICVCACNTILVLLSTIPYVYNYSYPYTTAGMISEMSGLCNLSCTYNVSWLELHSVCTQTRETWKASIICTLSRHCYCSAWTAVLIRREVHRLLLCVCVDYHVANAIIGWMGTLAYYRLGYYGLSIIDSETRACVYACVWSHASGYVWYTYNTTTS